jgi:hypothetical protein
VFIEDSGMTRIAVTIPIALALAACSSTTSGLVDAGVGSHPDVGGDASMPSQDACVIGDPSQPIEFTVVDRALDAGLENTTDRIPLTSPPQGGYVVFVGVRAKNVDGCPIVVTATIYDTCAHQLIGYDREAVALQLAADGWGEPKSALDITNFANVPTCPAPGAVRNIDGEPYELAVEVRDKLGRTAHKSMIVTPYCAQPEAYNDCICECARSAAIGPDCRPNYDAGYIECPGVDAGATD